MSLPSSLRDRLVFPFLITIILAAFLFWSQNPSPYLESSGVEMPHLQGEAAKAYLKQNGFYEPIIERVNASRYEIESNERVGASSRGIDYEAANPRQGYRTLFTPDQIAVMSEKENEQRWRLGLKLKGYGYGERLIEVGESRIRADGNRVEMIKAAVPHNYGSLLPSMTASRWPINDHRPTITEWYVNRPEGLEQGFTVNAPPEARGIDERLQVALEVSGDWRAELQEGGQAIRLRNAEGVTLLYNKLVAFDAHGRALESRMMVGSDEIRLEVYDEEAAYPVTIDPILTFVQEIHASDPGPGTFEVFGSSVAIDGDTIVVGASNKDDPVKGANSGAAYVFVRSGGMWVQEAKLLGSDIGVNNQFGTSIDMSGDTIVVGTPFNAEKGFNAGAAYVFVRNAGVWTQQQKLTGIDTSASDIFGVDVSIDGDNILIGASTDRIGAVFAGSAFVFVRNAGVWTQQAKLIASGAPINQRFAASVAIEGNRAVITAPLADDVATNSGAFYIFERSGTTWTEQARLKTSDAEAEQMLGVGSNSCAINGDTIIVSTIRDDDPIVGQDVGAAYVFVNSGGVWMEQQKLTPPDPRLIGFFGTSVAIEGDTVYIGMIRDAPFGKLGAGSVYVYTRAGGVWTFDQKLIAPDAIGFEEFGNAISVDNQNLVIGAWMSSDSAQFSGSAYIFSGPSLPTLNCPTEIVRSTDPGMCSAIINLSLMPGGNPTPTVTCTPPSGSSFPLGVTTVACTADNGNPTTASCTFTVRVVDSQAPVLTCPLVIRQNNGMGQCSAIVSYTATALDACDGSVTPSCNPASGTSFPVGITTVTCSATDVAGNTGTCSFNVEIADRQSPAITCPTVNISLNTEPGQCTAVATYTIAANDNCDGPLTPTCNFASGHAFPKGLTTVRCDVTDAAGNLTSCGFIVTVTDNENPTLACPSNITTTTDNGVCASAVNYSLPVASDNCPDVGMPSCNPASGSAFPRGVTTVTCSVSDAAGNAGNCSFTVTVNDDDAPSLVCPPNQTVGTRASDCMAVANFTATANDICDGAITPTCNPLSGSTFTRGVATVNCSATDAAGNTANCSFTVTVLDDDAPIVACPAPVTAGTAGGGCSAIAGFTATVTDNCDGAIAPNCSPASGSVFPKGITTVTCSATDTAGNTGNCSFTVTVIDDDAPMIACPANISRNNDAGLCSAVVMFTATATDNCALAGVVASPPSGTAFPVGVTTVSVTATDTSGNQSVCMFTVTVTDNEAAQIVCPPTQFVMQGAVTYPNPTISDNCAGASFACAPPSGSIFPAGISTVTCAATDASGNTSSCSFAVTTFDVCLQDDANSRNKLFFLSTTGDYMFCCADGTTVSGKGIAMISGCTVTLNHLIGAHRVQANVSRCSINKGTAVLQMPVGVTKCQITDRNTTNNFCACGN